MKVKRILVATDLSPSAGPIYRWSAEFARRFGSHVTLLNIDETNDFRWPSQHLQGTRHLKHFLQELAQHRQNLLAEARDHFEQMGLPLTIKTVVGQAAKEILAHAGVGKAELLIIGKRGTRQQERFSLGGTTKRVLRRVEIPTLVIPRGDLAQEEGPVPFSGKRSIAATTFSEACRMTLHATVEFAEVLDAKVDWVHVIKLPVPFSITAAEWPEILAGETRSEVEHRYLKDLFELLGEELAARCTPYTTLGVTVSGALRDLALESGADLITIPTHSSGSKHPPRFGSTTENVVKRSSVPVLVFPLRYLEPRFGGL